MNEVVPGARIQYVVSPDHRVKEEDSPQFFRTKGEAIAWLGQNPVDSSGKKRHLFEVRFYLGGRLYRAEEVDV